jgi:AmmeMemoRadiSam system protein A/AmmeMemoRadiSam system protein B
MPNLHAYALPHPPLAVPDVGGGEERKIQRTLDAFDQVAQEIAALAPETIIFITPHNVSYTDYFHISPGKSATGDLSRFRAPDVRFEVEYDTEFVEALTDDITGTQGERSPALDHGVTVPMWFINRRYRDYRAVRISPSGMGTDAHYKLGQRIAQTVERLGRKTVLIASGDLSHKLSADAPYGFAPEGEIFDKTVTGAFKSGDFSVLLGIPDEIREAAAECGYNPFVILAGVLDGQRVDAKLLSYEAPFGVGYAVASFVGTTALGRTQEGPYRTLARQSLEHAVKNGGTLPLPDGLPEEMLTKRAGAFVSLHKNGDLRGCIGTIAPTTDFVALEIIQNAVSAGLHDPRFAPVTEPELPHLDYKVDILASPEVISGLDELDVKRYGVIVSSGNRRGLLLPNLDGVDTVEEQVDIARQKAGIPKNAPVKLERFEVVRYE